MNNKMLVCLLFFTAVACFFAFNDTATAQEKIPREHVPESGVVSLAKTTPFNVALQALNEYSLRLERKPIIDLLQRTTPINIDVVNLAWRTALELITRANGLSVVETDSYFQITVETPGGGPAAQQTADVQQEEMPQKPITSSIREILISAKFFEADKKKLLESGVNWTALLDRGDFSILSQQNLVSGDEANATGTFQVSYIDDNTNIETMLKAMESEDIGEVIASPRITAIDGREGRVQIGQDFSIKQRDFAGNVLDVFVSTGIILTVKPVLVEEDSVQFIYLKVTAERSSANPGSISTIINKTFAETELLLNDGEEAVIGGLNSTEEYKTKKGVPVLKRIPKWFFGLGYLFGYESVNYSEKELIIFLKAEVVPALGERITDMLQSSRE